MWGMCIIRANRSTSECLLSLVPHLTPKVPSFEQARHPLAGSLFVDREDKGSDPFRVVGTNGLWDLVMSL